jgi:hypothetical protein
MAANVQDAGNNVSDATLNPAVTSTSTVAGGGRTYTLAQNVHTARVRKQRRVLQILSVAETGLRPSRQEARI